MPGAPVITPCLFTRATEIVTGPRSGTDRAIAGQRQLTPPTTTGSDGNPGSGRGLPARSHQRIRGPPKRTPDPSGPQEQCADRGHGTTWTSVGERPPRPASRATNAADDSHAYLRRPRPRPWRPQGHHRHQLGTHRRHLLTAANRNVDLRRRCPRPADYQTTMRRGGISNSTAIGRVMTRSPPGRPQSLQHRGTGQRWCLRSHVLTFRSRAWAGSVLSGGPDDDLVHVDARRLLDGEGDGLGDCLGRDRHLVSHLCDLCSDLRVC